MYVVLILLFLFLVCDEIRAKRSLRKAMGIKQPVGKVRKIGKAIRKAVKAAVREFREAREDSWEFHKAIQDARWEAREARIEKAGERMDAVLAGIEKRGKRLAQKTAGRMKTLQLEIEARKARQELEETESVREVKAEPVTADNEAQENLELVLDLERDARTAAMAADVPTIEFPEEDEKYFSSRKYESADD
ncbi:hypothetical protein [Aristaeella hokkaidonensis]|uniref:Uncharacterized protein n=1 Tax=Aristaeella hokkaidonensis TaxID=3046382 RepID=A0AC61MUV1_9FIRM|nr:hypothetical protein [Aristaeella hokkaidonensis]QUC66174.1 hypothetical protein JYE49_09865 [Aristaeella hokkaidonensis]SNT94819.1 hypothetical protein SAMN06297421_10747 [Aristaeella hokkaidonensis]